MGIARYIENIRDNYKDFLIDPVSETAIRYADVYSETENLKDALERAGFKSGDHVAIALENSITAALVILGVLKLGGVIIPVNLGWKKNSQQRGRGKTR